MERFLDLCNYSTTVCQCICDLGGACCPTVDPGSYALTQSFIQCVPTVPAYWEVSFVFRTSPFHQLTVRYRRPALNDCPVGDYVYDSHDFEGFGSWEVPNFGTVEVL
jgi:hypothetical protein